MKHFKPQRTTQGGIKIEFMLNRKRYNFAPVLNGRFDNSNDYNLAVTVCLQMARDLHANKFDETLKSYKPQTPEAIEAQRKAQDYDLRKLWEEYSESRRNHISESTFATGYARIKKILDESEFYTLGVAQQLKLWIVNNKSPQSANFILQQINACCKWGIELKLIEKNPFEGYKKLLNKKTLAPVIDINPFTAEERGLIIAEFSKTEKAMHYRYLVEFLFYTGCRPSEALALKWEKIQRNKILFSETYVKGTIATRLKTENQRVIYPNDRVKSILQKQKNLLTDDFCKPNMLVFPSIKKDKYIQWNWFAKHIWEKVLKNIPDLEYKNPYQMRHTFITLMLKTGVSPQDIARHCGNSPETIFKHYAGVTRGFMMPEI